MDNNYPVYGYPLPLTPGENYLASVNFSASYQPVEQWTSTGSPVYTQPQPNLPAPSSLIHNIVIPLSTTPVTRNRWQCPICWESFPRPQERNRHELTHLPYFIHCPLPHCTWRGNRADLFKKHWKQVDHCSYYGYYGRTPERSQIETFDPRLILNQIINGDISLREGEGQAIFLVQVKGYELQKPSMLTDPWGRSKRHSIERA